jgi:hypothetical protein
MLHFAKAYVMFDLVMTYLFVFDQMQLDLTTCRNINTYCVRVEDGLIGKKWYTCVSICMLQVHQLLHRMHE